MSACGCPPDECHDAGADGCYFGRVVTPEPVADDRARVIAEVLARILGATVAATVDRDDESGEWKRGARRVRVAVKREVGAIAAELSDTAAPAPAAPDPRIAAVEAFCVDLESTDDYVRSWKCARALRAVLDGDPS